MWRRSGSALFLIADSAAPSSSFPVVPALLREGSCALRRLPPSQVFLRPPHHPPPVLWPALRSLLQLPTLREAPSSVVGATRRMLWLGCFSYSSGAFPDGGCRAEERGQSTAACWNCGASPSEPFLVCGVCSSVQPVDASVDYFQIFGVEKKYKLRTDNLESKYKDWQKKLHPDLVHTKSEQERSYAAKQSARVIDAYRTLSKPIPRALYLLKLEGLHVDEERTISDPELLAEILEIREAVEEANDSQALEHIKSELEEKLQNWANSFGKAFQDCNFEDAVSSIQRMTYYERAIQEIVKKL